MSGYQPMRRQQQHALKDDIPEDLEAAGGVFIKLKNVMASVDVGCEINLHHASQHFVGKPFLILLETL